MIMLIMIKYREEIAFMTIKHKDGINLLQKQNIFQVATSNLTKRKMSYILNLIKIRENNYQKRLAMKTSIFMMLICSQ